MSVVDAPAGPPPELAVHPALAARPISADTWRRDAPDAHFLAIAGGVAVGRASVWWHDTPALPGHVVGLVGHYAAADRDAGEEILRHSVAALAARGCTVVVGPVDGSTWHDYRLVAERGSEPLFYLEPDTPDSWPEHFRAAGFAVLAGYTSALVDEVAPTPAGVAETARRLEADGYVLRPVDPARAPAELDALYDVSIAAFADNFLYTPISREAFHAQYGVLLPRVDPRLVLLAERRGQVVGFVFVFPDVLEARRAGRATTAIVKTLAVHPAHGGRGLGGWLVDRVQQQARALGLTRVIHALMIETNRSQQISRHYGRTFRRYAVYARPTS